MSWCGLSPSVGQDPCPAKPEKGTQVASSTKVTAPVLTSGPSWPICFDHIFDRPPAYRAARVDLSLQLQPAVVAQTHVSAGVDHCVHVLVEADGALPVFSSRGQF